MKTVLRATWMSSFWVFVCVFGLRQRLSREAMPVETVLVDTVEKCQNAVAKLFEEHTVAIDIEGIDLGRAGEVAWIQMCSASSSAVYLFDIYKLKESAFGEGGLRKLLVSENVTKLFYDVRGDNDALYHLHAVQVQAAYDIQIMWHLKFHNPADIYLQGLKQVMHAFLHKTEILSGEQMEAMELLKKQGLELFAPEHGGSYEVWKQRPMPPVLLQYAAADVKYLLGMKDYCTPKNIDLARRLDMAVKRMSAARLRTFVELPREQALDYSRKKYLDFKILDGFNDTGDISMTLYVPSHLKGLLIGKGGATIKGIKANSGARVSLNGDSALVVGQPAQVHEAVEQINRLIS